ncbi:MAG: YgiT-type zinc finger protein [Elusimicrobia bacterium]|nr:YgiT-type zinc finger protein [Elusimicrobiota bacterium]
MKCALCGGNLSNQQVIEEVIEGTKHVIVKVNAGVCENCHERYYPSGVIDKLIDIKERLKRNRIKLHPIGKVYETV